MSSCRIRCAVPKGGSGVIDRVGGFVGAVTNDVVAEEEEEDDGGESSMESTSIGVRGESPGAVHVVRDGVDGRRYG
jgi:hypothetical protein